MVIHGFTKHQGGYTEVAEALTTPERTITRQQVYAWWLRRGTNGFPAGTPGYRGFRQFSFTEVADWYAAYQESGPSVGGRPRKDRAA